MGKTEGSSSSSSWFTTVKKAFMSPKKLSEKKTSKRKEDHHHQQEEQRSGKRRWISNFTRNHPQQATVILQHCGGIRNDHDHDERSNGNVATTSKESQALAVALATTAAARAAIATAQAAVEVARLANNPSVLVRQHFAAVSIQTSFRAYLARRALRALKGVVKLQALVRGQNMRRRTELTLHGIQSLLRIQARVLHQRNRRSSFEESSSRAGRRLLNHQPHPPETNAQSSHAFSSQIWREEAVTSYASEGDYDQFEGRWAKQHHHRTTTTRAAPRYMAATESAKSRIRPQSAPKQRPYYSSPTNHHSPNQKQQPAKKRLSFPDGGDRYDEYVGKMEQGRMSTSSSCTDGYVSSSLFGSSR